MYKISIDQFVKMLSFDVVKCHACIEIEFIIDGDKTYDSCYLGKTVEKDTNNAVYWYGLVPDGSQAYDYYSFEAFVNALIFHGKSIKEIWDSVTLVSIDACRVEERLPFYLGLEPGPIFGQAYTRG